MARKKRLIIPVFIPFGGCTHRCVFCDQTGITGVSAPPDTAELERTVEAHLSTWKGGRPIEIAFYGGSFTALPVPTRCAYLEAAYRYVEDGRIDSLRVSTRPDCISVEGIELLKRYRVATVELGAQSMSDTVLALAGRGHDSSDTVRAVGLLKDAGTRVGIQLMPGLPGDTAETITESAQKIIELGPDFVRIYPTLVLKGTPLYAMYKRGDYTPWGLEEMVGVCRSVAKLFAKAGINVARMGLQTTESLRISLVAGPYHASFRQLVETRSTLTAS